MTPARWQHVREIVYEASELEASRRALYVAEQCGGDGTLRKEVEDLLAALAESGGFLESPVRPLSDSDETQIGPYRILDEAGRGGMGVVYRALREDEYRQVVAIKLVRAELATKPLTERFRVERQTLALLNHPNIARLLDGGTTADGRPYLVMEWIEGQPIHEFCRDRALPARERLQLFLQVCDAVAHAHRNLVVHRDLKPSNILITAEGRPKLLDFGIAKVFSAEEADSQQTMTMVGAQALTPEYASPEQVRQQAVTTASDIYSLGAVLYELLTGAQPHQIETRTPAAIERAVCDKPVPPASNMTASGGVPRATLRGDLDNILAKALEKDPARRYQHVDEFAEEIRRHLDSRPVLACPPSVSYRVSRFARRNKLLVISAAAVLVALAGGLSLAIWQAHRARIEEEIAERRFELARHLAGSVLYEFHDGIRDLQGSLTVQQLLLSRSLEYLDKLSAEARTNTALQRDLAGGYERVAELTGGGGVSNLGRDQEAAQSLRKALALRKQVLATDPRSTEFRRDLARTHRRFVDLAGTNESERLEHAGAALAVVENLMQERPNDPEIRNDLAVSEYDMGFCMGRQSRFPEAVAYYRRALSHAPNSDALNLAHYHKRLGAVLLSTNDLTGALAEYRAALAFDEPRVSANPADQRAKLDISYDYSDIGLIMRNLGRHSESIDEYRKAYRLRAEVAAADPHDARAAIAVASVAWRLAGVYDQAGETRRAERTFNQAVVLAESARQRFPESRDALVLTADVNLGSGMFYRQSLHACNRAQKWLQRALDIYRALNAAPQIRQAEELIRACSAGASSK